MSEPCGPKLARRFRRNGRAQIDPNDFPAERGVQRPNFNIHAGCLDTLARDCGGPMSHIWNRVFYMETLKQSVTSVNLVW
jgi:hypothetical protein